MEQKKTVRVIIASPGDIIIERKIVREICLGLNNGLLPAQLGTSFEVKGWEEMFPSTAGLQEITAALSEKCDVFVCIFHRKFGPPSARGAPDSLEQFLSAYESWSTLQKPHLIFFFKEVKVRCLKDISDGQLIKVLEFKENISRNPLIVCEDFSAPQEFCEKLHEHLEKWANGDVQSSTP